MYSPFGICRSANPLSFDMVLRIALFALSELNEMDALCNCLPLMLSTTNPLIEERRC